MTKKEFNKILNVFKEGIETKPGSPVHNQNKVFAAIGYLLASYLETKLTLWKD